MEAMTRRSATRNLRVRICMLIDKGVSSFPLNMKIVQHFLHKHIYFYQYFSTIARNYKYVNNK
ncbi:MAG: hypothetical protein A2Y97_11715 [Nitrospirae bacterium RBG_13_39_12]|nr:MAG: hypothetical protein A2Y97_11715 [Nitrospirae bacterium RBG_13_39_12]